MGNDPSRGFYPIVGIGADRGLKYDAANEAKAQATLKAFLSVLEAHFAGNTYLVGDAVTLADVIGANAMEVTYMCLMAPSDWAAYPATLRWLTTVYNQPQYLDSVGVVPACEKVMVYDPAGPQAMPSPQTLMEVWPAKRIRQTFIDYFASQAGPTVYSRHLMLNRQPPPQLVCSKPFTTSEHRKKRRARFFFLFFFFKPRLSAPLKSERTLMCACACV